MILRRYMTQQVASTTALVLGFLVVMMLGGRLIRYFGIAAEGNLDIGLLFTIIGYNLPYFLKKILLYRTTLDIYTFPGNHPYFATILE